MPRAFTTYFPVPDMAKLDVVGVPIPFMPGGPHRSLPSFARRKITSGDIVYLVGIRKGTLYRLARITVAEILTLDAFLERFNEHPEDGPNFRSRDAFPTGFGATLRTWPAWNFFFSTCTDEVLLAADSTPLSMDYPVPVEILTQLQHIGKAGTRPIAKILHDGKITSATSLQGIYQLTDESTALLDSLQVS